MESNEKFEKIKIKDNFHRSLTANNKNSDNTNRIQISSPNSDIDYEFDPELDNQRSYTVNFADSINGEEIEAMKINIPSNNDITNTDNIDNQNKNDEINNNNNNDDSILITQQKMK